MHTYTTIKKKISIKNDFCNENEMQKTKKKIFKK